MRKSVFASYAGGCKLRFICGNRRKGVAAPCTTKQKGNDTENKIFRRFQQLARLHWFVPYYKGGEAAKEIRNYKRYHNKGRVRNTMQHIKHLTPTRANQVGQCLKQKGRTKLFGLFLLHTDTQGRTAMGANKRGTLFVRFVLKNSVILHPITFAILRKVFVVGFPFVAVEKEPFETPNSFATLSRVKPCFLIVPFISIMY